MNAARPPGPPVFRTALVETGKDGGALPPRRVGTALLASLVAHAFLGLGLIVSALLSFGPISPPPISVRFFATAPAAPKLAPLRDKSEPPRIKPEPPVLVRREAATIPALRLPPPPRPAPTPRPRFEPPPLRVETAGLSIRAAENAPELRVRDAAPPMPRSATPSLGKVNAQPAIPSGSGPEPEFVFLKPGRERPRGAGGGIAGAGDGLPSLPGVGVGSTGRAAASGRGTQPGGSRGPELGTEGTFTTIENGAAALGRRYGAALIEAARLGQRTSDGARYSLLVPGLSEAYRQVALRGAWRAAHSEAGGLASAQVDRDAIAIHYDDGTLHVVVPTGDGLVALYVSAGGGQGAPRNKVGEAERALRALQRLARIQGS